MTSRKTAFVAESFRSVPELVTAIDEYVAHHNSKPKPFIWTASARDILQKSFVPIVD